MFRFLFRWFERRKKKKQEALRKKMYSLGRQIRSIYRENRNLLSIERRIYENDPESRDSKFSQRMVARVGNRKRNNVLLGQLKAQKRRLKRELARLA